MAEKVLKGKKIAQLSYTQIRRKLYLLQKIIPEIKNEDP